MPNLRMSLVMCSFSLAVIACEGPGREPIAPRFAASSASVRSVLAGSDIYDDAGETAPKDIAAALEPTTGRASGHADIFATARQNIVEEIYSFTAASTGDFPLAKGQFEGHALRFTGETVNIHAEVTCIAIVGTQAWIGGRITRATVDQQEVPNSAGTPLTFRVRDNGEDASVVDEASLWFLGFASEIAFCNTRPTTNALRLSTTGNIQVKPQ